MPSRVPGRLLLLEIIAHDLRLTKNKAAPDIRGRRTSIATETYWFGAALSAGVAIPLLS
jgi:hypothetical protein